MSNLYVTIYISIYSKAYIEKKIMIMIIWHYYSSLLQSDRRG